jgi:sialate O-acetylesterase
MNMHRALRIVLAVSIVAMLAAPVAARNPVKPMAEKPAPAKLRLPNAFSDHVVLQRGRELPVWGWAKPGAEVAVTLGENTVTAVADKTGAWKLRLPEMKAGGPYEMTVSAGPQRLRVKDILIGEVWIGSGQSNMQWSLSRSAGARKFIAEAKHPNIRLLNVRRRQTKTPAPDLADRWQVCSPKTVGGFSAVLYQFGRELHKELKVPVGLINASWGGSPIQPWTPEVGYELVEEFKTGKIKKGGRGPGMYNGMVAPLVPTAIRGAIWYQGESNVAGAGTYDERMKALILGWRKVWGQGEFPFYYVQLAPYGGYRAGKLPQIWEDQLKTLAVPNTGMAVITDLVPRLGNIHPPNKHDVGRRLSLWALAKDYGRKDLVYSGPLYKSMKVDGGTIVLSFDCVGGGLKSRDGKPLSHFTIAAADKKFVPAKAEIKGDTIVVSSDKVAAPAAVRFGWNKAAMPNLINAEGLPASPFRTDGW